jgi:hypothetical protein
VLPGAAAVEDEQVERGVVLERFLVAGQHPDVRIIAEQLLDCRRALRIDLSAHDGAGAIDGAHDPCEPHAAARTGLSYPPSPARSCEHLKESALCREARVLEAALHGEGDGPHNERWQVLVVLIGSGTPNAHEWIIAHWA